jgi:hypothetical protein
MTSNNDPLVIIKDALEQYDNNNDKYSKFIDKIFSIKIDNYENKIYFYDNKDKLKLSSSFEILGVYNNNNWFWSWGIVFLDKTKTNIAKKLLNYGIELSIYDNNFLKTELITSIFEISNKIELDIHIALASYLSKQPFIFKINSYEQLADTYTYMINDKKEDDYRYNYFNMEYEKDIEQENKQKNKENNYVYYIIKDFDKIKF